MLRTAGAAVVYVTEKALEQYAGLLSPSDVREIAGDLEAVKRALQTSDTFILSNAVSRLEVTSHRIADAMYRHDDGDPSE